MIKIQFKLVEDLKSKKDYIKNPEKVIETLKGHIFSLENKGINGKAQMYLYKFKIGRYVFDYAEGCGCDRLNEENVYKKVLDALYCVIYDYGYLEFYNNSYEDMISDFGWEDNRQSRKTYNAMVRDNEKLDKIFSNDELRVLYENLDI